MVISEQGWRKPSTPGLYLEVTCTHTTCFQSVDNLKRGRVLGCRQCYCERNNRREATTELDKTIMKHYGYIKARTTQASVNGHEHYGDKGIKLCPEWKEDPMLFVEYMRDTYKPGLSIDRIDNTKGYEPGNVRWATAKEQAFNRRTTIKVEWNNEVMSFKTFVTRYTQLSTSQAAALRKQGWTLEQLVAHTPKEIGARVRYKKCRT